MSKGIVTRRLYAACLKLAKQFTVEVHKNPKLSVASEVAKLYPMAPCATFEDCVRNGFRQHSIRHIGALTVLICHRMHSNWSDPADVAQEVTRFKYEAQCTPSGLLSIAAWS